MKNRLLIACTAFVLALSPALRAEDGPMKPEEKHTELGDQMEKMGKAFKALRGQIADPAKNASSLELLAKIKSGAEAGLKLKPEITADKPAEEQMKFVAAYQEKLKKMIDLIGSVEAAVKDGKNDDAKKLTDQMNMDERAAHKEFRKPPAPKP